MEIEVPILWVDDKVDYAESVAEKLKSWLEPQGLELKPTIRTDSSLVLGDVKNNYFELIIVDYMLPGGNGDLLIEKIRKSGCYQDILFYTGNSEKLKEILAKRFDGVFYVHKDFADARIQELIQLKLWRLSNPASVRGWIVADAIELEGMVTELLEHCFTSKDGFTFKERFLYSHNSPIDFGRKVDIFKGILNDLVSWLEKQEPKDNEKIAQLKSCVEIFNTFTKEIVQTRNAAAHYRIEETKDGKMIGKSTSSATPVKLDDDKLAEVRKYILKHRDNLLKLRTLI
jgi:CheY-like chemotaxis protein